MRAALVACVVLLLWPHRVAAQQTPVNLEVAITGGASTENVEAAAAQVRLFGEPAQDLRFYVEGAWAQRSASVTDAFGAAYPYDKRIRPTEMFAEKIFRADGYLAGVRAGRYRTPFGIHQRSDHAYSGFLRAPLIRYDGNWALSNNHLEGGIDLFASRSAFQVEASLGVPQDIGVAVRRRGLDRVVRLQAYRGALVGGVSHIRNNPSERRAFADGEAVFTGVDLRWMRGGTQLRGEWITGQPFNGPSTTGWYADVLIHRRALGPVTLVGRAEELAYDADIRSRYMQRFTAGARIQLSPGIVAHVNAVRTPRDPGRRTSVDVALSYVARYPR